MLQQTVSGRRSFLCPLLPAVLLLVGCGSSDEADTSPDQEAPPSGPSTQDPGADDEPVRELPVLNNAVGFDVFREPHARLPVPELPSDTAGQMEFDAGLPEPVISMPAGFDADSNSAPFFRNLANLEVLAGDIISIRFEPEDLDGSLPGMFPQKLPLGGTFEDNFDGSKTFVWQPLQEDVGILRFTVVAVDSEEPGLKASQDVLIRITLPDDPSTIPNVAPMLETLRDFTVRVNDPVVFELKGQDLNGTIPTLEVPLLPPGASFLQHPRFEEIYVLKLTPTVPGIYTLDVLVRDSVDPSLTATETVSFTVLDTVQFEGSGAPLKDLGQNRDLEIGFAALQSFYYQPDGAIYAAIAAREFNIVTPENSMKMNIINPLPGHFEFSGTDNLVRFAKLHDMRVHGHPLVWYRLLPEWIMQSDIADRERHMSDFIERIMGRYKDEIDVWDVVNEPIADNGELRQADSVWYEAMGESYIDKAMRQARLIAPSATLLINEFDISMAGPKFNGLIRLVERLQASDVPLDGIGFQMHLFSSYSSFEELRTNFATVAALGLDIYITELDVSISGEGSPSAAELQLQADVYRQIAQICIEQTRCKAIQMWGITDQYSFRSNFNPLPFDRAYQSKPAFQALQEALAE